MENIIHVNIFRRINLATEYITIFAHIIVIV